MLTAAIHKPQITTDVVALLDEWAARFFEELDYVREGENATKFAAQMAKDLPQVKTLMHFSCCRDACGSGLKQLLSKGVSLWENTAGDSKCFITHAAMPLVFYTRRTHCAHSGGCAADLLVVHQPPCADD